MCSCVRSSRIQWPVFCFHIHKAYILYLYKLCLYHSHLYKFLVPHLYLDIHPNICTVLYTAFNHMYLFIVSFLFRNLYFAKYQKRKEKNKCRSLRSYIDSSRSQSLKKIINKCFRRICKHGNCICYMNSNYIGSIK